MKPVVLIESPYRNGDRSRNLRYLAWCELDSANRGELPIASHGNCTAYWPEDDEHRALGFEWRDAVRSGVRHVAYYSDLGISPGAKAAMKRDRAENIPYVVRALDPDLLARFEAGEHAPGSMRRVAALADQRGEWCDEISLIAQEWSEKYDTSDDNKAEYFMKRICDVLGTTYGGDQ